MAQQFPSLDPTRRLFEELKSKNDDVRTRASNELRDTLIALSREWSSEKFADFYNSVSSRINSLVQSPEPSEKLGGLLAVDRLINTDIIDAAQKTSRFAGYLHNALRSNDPVVLDRAAQCLGHLAQPGGALTAELVESEIQSAMEWLQSDRQDGRRLAAVLVIRDLAKNAPTLLYGFVPQVFELIWAPLRDSKELTRKVSAEAVSACLAIIVARDAQFRQEWFSRIYDEALNGLKSPNIDWIHGSLLILQELLLRGAMFMHDFYRNACEIILRLKDHRDPRIRAQVVQTVPILADYAPVDFINNYLHKFMIYLQAQLKRERERNAAFVAIGLIAKAVGSSMAQYLDGTIVYIRESLSAKNRNRAGVDEGPVFQCISMLSYAVGQTLSKYMDALLDPIFACGWSKPVEQALVDMAHYIPPIRAVVQEKLLDMLSLILIGTPYRPLGCPDNRTPPLPSFAKDYGGYTGEHTSAEIALALWTLGTFDFSGHILNEFVRDVTVRYAESEKPEIRKAAALTCCQLFVQDPILHQTSGHSIEVVSDVVDKLLTVAVGDPEAEIRQTVLLSLDSRFDRHLARPENIRCLFLAVNDEVFSVREAAITIIGRLSSVNPAYVFPPLRKLLVNLLTGLGYSNTAKQKEEGAQLIRLFVRNASKLIRTYVEPMVAALLPKATDPNSGVAATTLGALGELATVGGDEMTHHIPEIMPIVLEALQDLASHSKREAALQTLGSFAINSGYVIDPYLDHPQLLGILINIIKTENHEYLRQDAIKLVGVLGALDPYRFQQISEGMAENKKNVDMPAISDVSLIMQGLNPSNEEYYPTVVIHMLLQTILKDHSLVTYHSAVIDAIVIIFKTLGLKCVPFLGQIIPAFLAVIRGAPSSRLGPYFNQLAILVSIVKQHVRAFLPDILKVVRECWNRSNQIRSTILSLVEAISRSLEGEFKKYLADLLPLMLGVLEQDLDPGREASSRILHTFLVFGSSAEEYMHLIVPAIVRMFDSSTVPYPSRKAAIETLSKLCRQVNVSDFSSTMLHPLARIIGHPVEKMTTSTSEKALKPCAMDCLCSLILQLNREFLHYIPLINKAVKMGQVNHHNYNVLVAKLQKGESLPQDLNSDEIHASLGEDTFYSAVESMKLPVNQQHLKNAWETSQKSTREDWQEWMRRFSVELLKESPSHALRACASLAGIYQPLAKDLFNAAFASCWTELYDQYQEELVRSIEKALTSPNIPLEILHVLLNLAEFMEHDDKALPIDIRELAKIASKCHAYAKALHYKELQFEQDQNGNTIEALISINNQLQQTDAAIGILRKAQHYSEVELKETWFEKLQRWEEALNAYNRREQMEPRSFDVTMGKMRCLHALGEWRVLSELAQDQWQEANSDQKKQMAALAAAAAWGRGQWELVDPYLSALKEDSADRSFFGAVLSLHRNSFDEAERFIGKAREAVNSELTAIIGESYNRAYNVVVRTQMLTELEEIITYKKSESDPRKQEALRKTWDRRLLGCQQNVEVWQRMLKVRGLVVDPGQNLDMWIKFANLCRKTARSSLAERTLASLENITRDEAGNVPPQVSYARLKYNWAVGNQQNTLNFLTNFTSRLSDEYGQRSSAMPNGVNGVHADRNGGITMSGHSNHETVSGHSKIFEPPTYTKLLAKCYLKQGDWQAHLHRGDWSSDHVRDGVQDILNSYAAATGYDRTSYKAWHAWALANFEVVTSMGSHPDQDGVSLPEYVIHDHVVPAVQGFFKSISLSTTSSLQDTLRLLTLWFAHGSHPDVNLAVTEGFQSVSIDTWLEVIPQLIARINQVNQRARQSVHRLLAEVGKAHPQALVYPLTVAIKSNVARRSHSATQIMDSMRQHSPALVEQAELVSHELIRVAVLWHELWHEGLEEASRLYFGDHNVEGMFATLAPLHEMLDRGPETLREVSFAQAFGQELREARRFCNVYKQSQERGDLNQAWDLYYTVFRKISRQLPAQMTLDLKYVSPRLREARNLDLAAPGSYHPGRPVVKIVEFDHVFTVIPSKQRPRKMTLKGSDGVSYTYALKGHEDIRQDERVMQLFGLVNTLLDNDADSFKRHLNIQRFPAIPLSQNSGLLGWVPNSDTLHNLIKEYRESRRILLNIEHRIMLQMAPDYDNLALMQKVEVFGYAMDNTTGKDLYRVLWLKSKSSESWLERRTNYTRSLAVMSMVGYILGLGDRHPSNLMLDRITGNIIHIDFGDCFEVAMHREKYPERVPFRLTRMLTFAMEVSNIEGSFRITCEAVMRVIRDNKESLVAVLEAFIHDPLLNWRLNVRESPPRPHFRSERRASIIENIPVDLLQNPAAGPNHEPPPVSPTGTTQHQQQAPPAPPPQSTAVATSIPPSSVIENANPHRRRRPSVLDNNANENNTNGPVSLPPHSSSRSRSIHSPNTSTDPSNPTNSNATPNNPPADAREVQNARALQVLERVKEKLTGRDFKPSGSNPSNTTAATTSNNNNNTITTTLLPAMTSSSDHPGPGIGTTTTGGATGGAAAGAGGPGAAAEDELLVAEQVEKLIKQATEPENLCQHYIGWCSFW